MGEAAALRPLASGKPHGEWFGLAGIAVMALPTLLSLGRETWSTEAGAHGPIVLATGIWLFWRCWAEWVGAAPPGNPMLSGPLFLAILKSEEHTAELQSLNGNTFALSCLK